MPQLVIRLDDEAQHDLDEIRHRLEAAGFGITRQEGHGDEGVEWTLRPHRQNRDASSPSIDPGVLDIVEHGVVVCDAQARIIHANPRARDLFGWEETPLGESAYARMPLYQRDCATVVSEIEHPLARALKGSRIVAEQTLCVGETPAPQCGQLLVTARPVHGRQRKLAGVALSLLDVSGESPTEKALRRQRNLYAALSEFNQLVVLKAPAPEELFEQLCRVAVDYGHLQLAWIGMPDEAGWIRPVASRGAARDYLHHVRICVDGRLREGQGPTGTAMREKRRMVVHAMQTDPSMGPWQQAAHEAGLRSSAAFPVFRGGEVVASLNVYSDEEDYFTSDLLHLLDELVMDASFSLDNFDHHQERRRLVEILEATPDFVGISDPQGRILYHNPAARRFLNQEQDLGRIPDCHTGEGRRKVAQGLKAAETQGTWGGETEFVDSEGRCIPFSQVIIAHCDDQGEVTHFSTIARNISHEKESEEKIRELAYQDALTGLANRTLLLDHLEMDYRRALRQGRFGALLYMDMDEFKAINDSLGHAVGDALLKALARRLSGRLRAEDTLARIGGDEFVMLLGDLGDDQEAAALAAQRVASELLDMLVVPIEAHGHRLHVTLSIGITGFPYNSTADPMDVLRQADTAMYAGKRVGRGVVRFYDPAMRENVRRRLDLEQDLQRALDMEELHLSYQPILALPGQEILGFEALLRWEHPTRGMISPAEFIPVAEQTGQIIDLGNLVMNQALRTVRRWIDIGLMQPGQQISVNVSPPQFAQADFVQRTTQLLGHYGVPGERLNLEITEGVVVRHMADTTAKLRLLQQHGISIALDDFGTGYSSLAYLTQLPLQTIKIDRSFVQGLGDGHDSADVVEAILTMAIRLGLSTIAEGVETAEQCHRLSAWGCHGAQGFYLAYPLPAPDAEDYLLAHRD
ncbi:EAL domain-containing protein [Aquisalimonas sp. 2447]|uniref:EAL domain-containing protein n=1 Tax=Aquisalimonas sp. 2447 TaxID=2740807 RepID=UPI001432482B|nr:EAL domain-containing protein [Aquisalimonas sp. 2447]QIT55270.1 EAL domain-containing protein [Aquisalimonas sp. 2447]